MSAQLMVIVANYLFIYACAGPASWLYSQQMIRYPAHTLALCAFCRLIMCLFRSAGNTHHTSHLEGDQAGDANEMHSLQRPHMNINYVGSNCMAGISKTEPRAAATPE